MEEEKRDGGIELRLSLPRQSQVFFLLLMGLMLWLTWIVFRPFVIFTITGIFVAVLALPIDRFWERSLRMQRAPGEKKRRRRDRLSAVLTILTLFLLLTVPIAALGLALAEDAVEAQNALNGGLVEDAIGRAIDILDPSQTPDERNQTMNQALAEIEPRINTFLSGLVSDLGSFVGELFIAVTIILFVVYYVLTDGARLVAYIKRATPLPRRQVEHLLREAHRGLHGVFVGQILTSTIQGALGGIGFLIAGVPAWVLWAAVMAVLSLLPVVGAFLVWVPAVIWLLLVGKIWQAAFLTIWGIIVVSHVDNFVRPKLIGNRTNIHPIFVLIGVLGGVTAFGFVGLFLGPLLVGVTISVLKVWEREYLDPRVGVQDQWEDDNDIVGLPEERQEDSLGLSPPDAAPAPNPDAAVEPRAPESDQGPEDGARRPPP